MRYSILRWTNFAVFGLIALSISSTGCKSGWKMPGADLFSFKRKPSESMIAGQGPSLTTPTSPSTKYDPKAITSTVAGVKPNSSPTGYSNPASNFASNAGPAQANGFQTGPYKTASASSGGTVGMPNQLAPTSMPNTNYGSTGMTNNYALGTPGSLPASNVAGAAPGYGYSGSTSTYAPPAAQTYAGATASGTYGYSTGAPALNNGMQASPQLAGIAAPPMSSYPATSTYVPVGNMAGSQTYTPPTSYATQTNPASYANPASYGQPATASISSAGAYRPGSTGRTTSYDLPQAGGGYSATNASGMTATGTNSTGYGVPPINR